MSALAQAEASSAALRATLDSVFASPAYRWADSPWLLRMWREWWGRLRDWLVVLRADNPTAFRMLVIALLIALVLILAHGLWIVWRTLHDASVRAAAEPRPSEARGQDAAWYLREADRAAAEGRMAAALQLAFVGLALTLEAQGLLRYHASKTPAECARDARLAREDRERLRRMVRTMYGHVFGGHPFGQDDYRRWRADVGAPWHAPAG